MKKWLILAIIGLVVALGAAVHQAKYERDKWKIAMANIKNYDLELSDAKEKNTAYQLTIEQLEYFKDSIFQELDATRKELGIKDKQLKALQYVQSSFTRTDTIIFTQVDTLFREPTLAIDTLLGDEWYKLRLGLQYPSTIAVKPEFKSEKHIVVSSKKETVNPPKKFFLFRWFQRKHYVLKIDVIEKNPYVENASSRYIEIIK